MANLPKSGTVTGQGTETLYTNWGKNQTRADITHVYRASGGGVSSGNTLTIVQKFTALAVMSSQSSVNVYSRNIATSFSITGTANGKYIRYELSSAASSANISVTSSTEGSSGTAHAFTTSYTQVSSFQGGSSTYDFVINLSLPAYTVANANYTLTIYTADTSNPQGSGSYASKTFTIVAVPLACESMTISGDDAISNNTNKATYIVDYYPTTTYYDSCTWMIRSEDESIVSISPNGNSCEVTVLNGAYNDTIVLSAINQAGSPPSDSKSVQVTYSTPVDAIEVQPLNIGVAANLTSDNTPKVTLNGITTRMVTVAPSSDGFIDSASINTHTTPYTLTTTWDDTNVDSTQPRSATVTLSVNNVPPVVVYYTQLPGIKTDDNAELEIDGLNVNRSTGLVKVKLNFTNDNSVDYTFNGLGVFLYAYKANIGEDPEMFLIHHEPIQTEHRTSANSSDTETFTFSVSPSSIPSGYSFRVVAHNSTKQSDVIVSAGTDNI